MNAMTPRPVLGTILVIERNPHTAGLLEYLLKREGYDVVAATDGAGARRLMASLATPVAVFLDLELSKEDGFGLLQAIRHQPGWQGTPVLMLVEPHTLSDVSPALSAGASDYIVQPFHHAELLGQIHRYTINL